MNYKKEAYPTDLQYLLEKATKLSTNIVTQLNRNTCPYIGELYMELHQTCGAKPDFSVVRDIKKFDDLGYIANTKSGKSKSFNEFKGLYVFGEQHNGKVTPVYIGISRVAYKRLRNHTWGKTANTATLAYLMAKNKYPNLTAKTVTKEQLEAYKTKIKNYKVVLIPVKEDYDLYFLEVALAGILKTKWNSFRTH